MVKVVEVVELDLLDFLVEGVQVVVRLLYQILYWETL